MMKKNMNNDDCEFYDTYNYSQNIIVKNKEVEIPKIYTINFFHEFDYEAEKYKPYFEVFEKAKENDEIIIYLNSCGGSITTLNLFINAIQNSKCKNITARINYAASAAAILSLVCDKIIFNTNSTLMFHTYSSYFDGKGQEIKSSFEHFDKSNRKIIKKYCKRIMSDKEIEEMFNGKDFHFDEEEALERLKKYNSIKRQKYEKNR